MGYLDAMTLDDKLTDDEIRQLIEIQLENDLEVSKSTVSSATLESDKSIGM